MSEEKQGGFYTTASFDRTEYQTENDTIPENPVPVIKKRPLTAHKGTFGTATLICGSDGMAGAAMLAGKAALKSGVGILRLVLPRAIYGVVTISLPEAVCVPYEQLCDVTDRILESGSLLIGCGLSQSDTARQMLSWALNAYTGTLIIDADGLNLLAGCIECTVQTKAKMILTPHPGEMARLCGVSVAEIEAHRAFYATKLAQTTGAVVVLKGHETLIASPDGRLFYNPTGNPGMATGGSGDVLAGMTAALAANGRDPFEAALTAVYLHGYAGDMAAEQVGEVSLLPSDLIRLLPETYKRFEERS